ncbi:MAG TPA: type 4a pilus biogenesis protein PilO [Gaiellaceae bacterium]|nr:type 4a pilus biogenesis protein PilO [Gaiellaceae bacterium]
MQVVLAGFGALALVVGIAGFLLVVSPQQSKITSLDDQIASQQAELAGLHSAASHKPDLRAAELFQLSRALPDDTDQAGIVLTLAQLAQRSGVTLSGMQFQTPVALADGSTAVPVSVVVQGKWSSVTAFLAALRAQVKSSGERFSVAGRLFDVDQVQLSTGSSSSSSASTSPSDVIQATLTVNAFTYGTPAPAPSATTTGTTTTTTSSSQQALGATGGS